MTTELVNKLKNGTVVFKYRKNDGTWRLAVGTLNVSIINQYAPKETVNRLVIASDTNRYFDLDAKQWRRVAYNAPIIVVG